jgi:hypothetical protein
MNAKKDKDFDTAKLKAPASAAQFRVLSGFSFGADDQRVEPGPLTVQLPADVLADLQAQGVIVEEKGNG